MQSAVHMYVYMHCVSMRKIVCRGNATEVILRRCSHAEEYVSVNIMQREYAKGNICVQSMHSQETRRNMQQKALH
jgi:hypothetical protein